MQQRFEQLVDYNGGRLLQLARLILRSSSDAEDIVQETLIKLWNHLPALAPGSEAAWLTTCARNACYSQELPMLRRASTAECGPLGLNH